ncbi:hypothetical protein ACQKLP_06215 [Chitinophaga sp. NPDC101104]|uniref:hypothetical protein n=1 Tax=Chitinophaga sp. NPDC101104 TaxID=3390561 RepID=UPI003CFE7AD9
MEWIKALIFLAIIVWWRSKAVDLTGGTLRWFIAGRKRRWKAYQHEDEKFDNFRVLVLFLLISAAVIGFGYWCYIKIL